MTIKGRNSALPGIGALKRSSILTNAGSLELTEDQNEPELFLFQSDCKQHRLAFTRILLTDYPLRVLIGNADDKDKELNILKGQFSRDYKGSTFYLVFINMSSIERYLTNIGELRQSEIETNTITQFSKIIMSNSKFCQKNNT